MELLLKRIAKKSTYTIGKLYINGAYFCDTLEDKDRGLKQSDSLSYIQKIKVQEETAIPSGKYELIVNYSSKFKRNLPRLLNVPGFSGILIHRGNASKDTAGCILIGENKVVGKVINSTKYELELTKILTEASNKETIHITLA